MDCHRYLPGICTRPLTKTGESTRAHVLFSNNPALRSNAVSWLKKMTMHQQFYTKHVAFEKRRHHIDRFPVPMTG